VEYGYLPWKGRPSRRCCSENSCPASGVGRFRTSEHTKLDNCDNVTRRTYLLKFETLCVTHSTDGTSLCHAVADDSNTGLIQERQHQIAPYANPNMEKRCGQVVTYGGDCCFPAAQALSSTWRPQLFHSFLFYCIHTTRTHSLIPTAHLTSHPSTFTHDGLHHKRR